MFKRRHLYQSGQGVSFFLTKPRPKRVNGIFSIRLRGEKRTKFSCGKLPRDVPGPDVRSGFMYFLCFTTAQKVFCRSKIHESTPHILKKTGPGTSRGSLPQENLVRFSPLIRLRSWPLLATKTSSCNSLSSCTKDIFLQLFIFLHQRHLLTAIFLQLFLARIVRSHLYGYKCTPPGTRLSHQRLFVNCLYTGTQGGASLLCSPYVQMI